MGLILRPLMRGVDRLKILANSKTPTVLHAPYTVEMRHIVDPGFLEGPERFCFEPPRAEVRVLREGRLRSRRLQEIAFQNPVETRWPENSACYGYHLRIGDGKLHPVFVTLHGWGRKSLSIELWRIGLRLARHNKSKNLLWIPHAMAAACR
jgi:hypothetical protein